jgi:hypothetical protein
MLALGGLAEMLAEDHADMAHHAPIFLTRQLAYAVMGEGGGKDIARPNALGLLSQPQQPRGLAAAVETASNSTFLCRVLRVLYRGGYYGAARRGRGSQCRPRLAGGDARGAGGGGRW